MADTVSGMERRQQAADWLEYRTAAAFEAVADEIDVDRDRPRQRFCDPYFSSAFGSAALALIVTEALLSPGVEAASLIGPAAFEVRITTSARPW